MNNIFIYLPRLRTSNVFRSNFKNLYAQKSKKQTRFSRNYIVIIIMSCRFSLPFIASGRSSGLHTVSSHSCCMYVRAGRPAFAWPYVGVHWSTSLMSSSLLLQQCPACLVRLTWIVFMMGGRWLYSWCLVGCVPPGLQTQTTQIIYCFLQIYLPKPNPYSIN